MRIEIFLILAIHIVVCSFQESNCNDKSSDVSQNGHARFDRAVTENVEEDSNIVNLKVLNGYNHYRRSSQQPSKRSSDKKPSSSKRKAGKSKERKVKSTTSRIEEDTQAEQNESTTTATVTTSTAPPEDEEPKASEESRSAKKDDIDSVDDDVEATDYDAEPKFRMGSLPKKSERVAKAKEPLEEGKENLRHADAEIERTTPLNMEEKLDRLISKLLKESEDAEKRASTSPPSEATGRKAPPNIHESPRAIAIHSRCDTSGSSCYNPLQQILRRVNPIIPALINQFPHRVIIQPRFRSIIYH